MFWRGSEFDKLKVRPGRMLIVYLLQVTNTHRETEDRR